MVFALTLGSQLDATTNPDPNTLATLNPYPAEYTAPWNVSEAWTTQEYKAIFPKTSGVVGKDAVRIHNIPSDGAAIEYTLAFWFFDHLAETWAKSENHPDKTYTGEIIDEIKNPGREPVAIQIVSISAGTLTTNVDDDFAQVL
jgi:hypothetical protein